MGRHIFYWFAKPGTDITAPKVSSSIAYEPWKWVFGTGVYIDDVDRAFWHSMVKFGLIFALITVIVAVVALLISRTISRPMHDLAEVTSQIGAHNFAVAVPGAERADEIGKLAKAILILRDEAASAERLRDDQERSRRNSETERRTAMLALADNLEQNVQGFIETMVSAVNELKTRPVRWSMCRPRRPMLRLRRPM